MMYARCAVTVALLAATLGVDAVALQSIPASAGSLSEEKSLQRANAYHWHPDEYWPSIFVAIFSRRSAYERRDVLRHVWKRSDYEQGKMVYRFALCQHDDSLDLSLTMENATYGDLMIMECHEGYGDGMLTRKTTAAMKEYDKNFHQQELFMKIDDDTFAAWSRLWPKISRGWENHSYHMYMGVMKNESAPSRDPFNTFYEPEISFPRKRYPRSADGGPGYILGGQLVSRMLALNIPQSWQLYNEDKAVAVWVDVLVSALNETVEYINLYGHTGYATTAEEWQGQLNWFHRGSWISYPLMLHHRLSAAAIACLSLVEAKRDPQARIDHCFNEADNTWIPMKFMHQAEGLGAELWLRRHRRGKHGI